MIYCGKAEFGQISRSISLNSGAIRLKRSKNLTQIGFYPRAPSLDAAHQFTLPSLRSVKPDRLLAELDNEPFFHLEAAAFHATQACRGPWDPTTLRGAVIVALLACEIEWR